MESESEVLAQLDFAVIKAMYDDLLGLFKVMVERLDRIEQAMERQRYPVRIGDPAQRPPIVDDGPWRGYSNTTWINTV